MEPPYPAQTSLTVNPRTGFAFSAVSPTKQSNGYQCGSFGTLSVPNPPSDSASVGKYCDMESYSYNFLTIGGDGPNTGFSYVTSASNGTAFNWVIAPDADNPASQFYQAQCGNYNPTTNTEFISGANLRSDTTRHESGAVQSHYNNYVVAQNDASNNAGVGLEAAVDKSGGQTFQTFVKNDLAPRLNAITTATGVEPCNNRNVNQRELYV
jgi:hypothetical protein